MPTVPTYDSQVQTQNTPSVRFSGDLPTEALGVGASQRAVSSSLDSLSNDFGAIAKVEQEKADETAFNAASRKALEWKNKTLMDPDNSPLKARGQTALGISEKYGAEFSKFNDEIYNSLSTSEQKAKFAEWRNKEETDFNFTLDKHTFTEVEKWDKEERELKTQELINDSMFNFTNPRRIAENKAALKGLVEQQAKREGVEVGSKAYKAMEQKTLGKMHNDIIKSMIDAGDDITASKYLKANGEELGEYIDDARSMVEAGGLKGKAQRLADEITSNYDNLTVAQEEIKNKTADNPKLREAVSDMVKTTFAQRDQKDMQLQTKTWGEMQALIDQGATFDQLPLSKVRNLDSNQRESLRRLSLIKQGAIEVKPDIKVYNKYDSMPLSALSNVSDLEFASNVAPYVTTIQRTELEQKRQLAIKSFADGDQESLQKLNGLQSDNEMVFQALRDIKAIDQDVPASKLEGNDLKAYYDLQGAAKNAFMSYAYSYGKQPNDLEKKKIVNELVMNKVWKNNWFKDEQVPAFLIEDYKDAYVPIEEIPDSDQTRYIEIIRSGLGSSSINTSNAVILSKYKERIQKAAAARRMGLDRDSIRMILLGQDE